MAPHCGFSRLLQLPSSDRYTLLAALQSSAAGAEVDVGTGLEGGVVADVAGAGGCVAGGEVRS